MKSYQRATTRNRALSDNRALEYWRGRMVAKGIALRDDLRAIAAATKLDDKKTLDEVAEAALEAAKGSSGRNLGAALHAFVQQVNEGENPDVPSDWRADVDAYKTALAEAGLTVVPGMVERVTCVHSLGVAGTFDMVVTDGDRYYVADLKSSPNVHYALGEIAIQLAHYAHGINQVGMLIGGYQRDRFGRYVLPDPGDGWEAAGYAAVDLDRALVVHLPPGQGTCDLIWLDIEWGWRRAQTCAEVFAARAESRANRRDDGTISCDLILSPPPRPAGVVAAPVPQCEPVVTAGDATGPGNLADILTRIEGIKANDGVAELIAEWPAGLPTPKHLDRDYTDTELYHIGLCLARVEAKVLPFNPPPRPEVELAPEDVRVALHHRFTALPKDLRDDVIATCKAKDYRTPSHPTFRTLDVDLLEPVLIDAEGLHAQRRQECVEALAPLSSIEVDAVLATIGIADGQPVTGDQRDHLMALAGAVGYGLLEVVPGMAVLHAPNCIDRLARVYGSKRELLAAGKTVAEALGLERPASSAQIASEPLLVAVLAAQHEREEVMA